MARHNPSEGPPSRKYNIIGADIPETVLFKGDSLVSSLSGTPRVINCVYYYDDTGSILFERLCSEPTYYLFRTEKEIISQNAKAIAGITGPVSLIELGSGNAGKTTLLVDAYVKTHGPASYTAIDINHSILE
ncbi:MAG: L-histidine N(alpha)-methyltransferase, partial [Mesorhizobium sp.]